MNQRSVLFIAVVGSVVVAIIGVAQLRQSNGSTENRREQTSPVTPAAQQGAAVPTSAPGAALAAPANMLTADGVQRVLGFVASGKTIAATPEYQRFLAQAIADHKAALALLTEQYEMTPAHDVMARVLIFGVVMEVSEAIKRATSMADSSKVDAFLMDSRPLIDRQLNEPSKVPLPRQDYPQEELDRLVHDTNYIYENQTLYANTYRPKFMAIAVLREAATPYAIASLAEIAGNNAIDANIRQIAAMGARRER